MPHTHVKDALPKLRRHAFILAGNRAVADVSVAECLMAYRRAPHRVRPEAAEIDLFRLFHATTPLGMAANSPAASAHRALAVAAATLPASRHSTLAPMAGATLADASDGQPAPSHRDGQTAGVLGRFRALPAAQRQVLTLVSVEGFSVEECAHVLDVSAQRVGALLAEARRRLANLPA